MLIQNHHHVPGPGDCMPPDMSRDEARREARPEAVKVIADFIFAERMTSLAWISDAQGDFLQAEYNAMDATIAEIAAKAATIRANEQTGSYQPGLLLQKLGGLLFSATEASIRRGAEKEAEIRLYRMEREDEAGYLVEQAEI